MEMPLARNPERGIALPFALVVTLAMVVLVTDLGIRAQLAFDRARRAVRMVEARSLQKIIMRNLSRLDGKTVAALSEGQHEFDINDFQVRLAVEPLESRININRLDDLILGGPIKELFAATLKRERFEKRAYPCALDWIDPDDDPRSDGAEGSDYSGEDVVPRNASFETIDELTLVRGFRDPSSFERIRPMLTAFGSGKIYIPAVSDKVMDAFEDVYGPVARNSLEDIRRNPGRSLALPSNGVSPAARENLLLLITQAPTTWQITVVLTTRNFYAQSRYVLVFGDDPAKAQTIVRVG